MKKYFYDCEFLEDGTTIDFISIGIVCEDGREYYAVSNEFNTRKVAKHNWLMENVMNSIDHEAFVVSDGLGWPVVRDIFVTDPASKSKYMIAAEIKEFLEGEPAELWAWYGAYDHVCLAQLYGTMIDLPDSVPMFTNDIKTLVGEVKRKMGKTPILPSQPVGHHNALDDARWNKVRYDNLRRLLDG